MFLKMKFHVSSWNTICLGRHKP